MTVHTKLTKKAINLAYRLHTKEQDEYGLPFIYQIFNVASKMDDEFGHCAALLYKAVDNKKTTIKNLQKEFPFEVTDAIFILITDDSLAYPDYIRRIKTNEIATKIKISEIEEKTQLLSLINDKNKKELELKRYNFALNILKKQ